MFTGIVTAIGTVRTATDRDGGRELVVAVPWDDLVEGESIAVDGACLTVVGTAPGSFCVHVIVTSLDRTLLGRRVAGDQVNLERALRLSDRLGGHLVQGHVDGVGEVRNITTRADAQLLDIVVPDVVAQVSIPLGSITVNGVSLTVNSIVEPGVIQVSLIPFTLDHTTLGALKSGDEVQLEGDTVGKYVQQLSAAWRQAEQR